MRRSADSARRFARPLILRAAMAGVVLLGMALSGCSSVANTPAQGPRPTASASVGGVREARVERAVRRHGNIGVASASCRAERGPNASRAAFGPTHEPVMSCLLDTEDGLGYYDVEVLDGGCFVAKPRHAGRTIHGCGVDELTTA